MLEPLAGRLKWERTGDGIRVVIPARLDGYAIRHILLRDGIFIVVYYLLMSLFDILKHGYSAQHYSFQVWFAEFLACAIVLFGFCLLLWLTNRTIVTLTSQMMIIEWRYAGFHKKTRKYLTKRLYAFRCECPGPGKYIVNEIGQSEIQFEEDLRTQSFAPGITDDEASALIARMNEVYRFPKDAPVPAHA